MPGPGGHRRGAPGRTVLSLSQTRRGRLSAPCLSRAAAVSATRTCGRSPGSVFGAGLFNSLFWIDRTVGVGGMFATQVLPYFHPDAWDLCGQFEAAVYDHLAG